MNAWALSMPSRARPTVMPARAAAAAAVGARRGPAGGPHGQRGGRYSDEQDQTKHGEAGLGARQPRPPPGGQRGSRGGRGPWAGQQCRNPKSPEQWTGADQGEGDPAGVDGGQLGGQGMGDLVGVAELGQGGLSGRDGAQANEPGGRRAPRGGHRGARPRRPRGCGPGWAGGRRPRPASPRAADRRRPGRLAGQALGSWAGRLGAGLAGLQDGGDGGGELLPGGAFSA
jgi:hypothetical protein